ncbi:MAG: hypothetical protein HC851_13490 [Acaryochloris sp. RU_4_1]|nr:hypothetical protein [Acaryochloris sp. RU_4_1]NJR56394.1 hypothetical protein [Acaryochloris sp. CRU_2_0]
MSVSIPSTSPFCLPTKGSRFQRWVAAGIAAAALVGVPLVEPKPVHAQFNGVQATQPTCNSSSFMVGDVNSAIQNVFGDIPFVAGPLCGLMDKALLVTIIVGFVILVLAGIDADRNQKQFMAALNPFFKIIFGFFFAWMLIGIYSINSSNGNASNNAVQGR